MAEGFNLWWVHDLDCEAGEGVSVSGIKALFRTEGFNRLDDRLDQSRLATRWFDRGGLCAA